MKILHITASYKPAFIYGGPIYSVAALCEELNAESLKLKAESGITFTNNHSTITVYTTLANGKTELLYRNGVKKIVEGVSVKYFKRITKDHSHFSPALLIQLWRNAKKFDIIHIHAWWNLVSMGAVLICLVKGIKPIVSPRGMLGDYTFSIGKKIFHLLFGKYFLRNCDFHATTSMEADEIVKRVFGDQKKVSVVDLMEREVESGRWKVKGQNRKERLRKRIFIIHNIVKVPKELPIDTRKFDGTMNLIFLSRIHHKKGIELLLDALSTLKFPFKLTIVGEGEADYVKSLKWKVESLNLTEQIDWFDAVYGDQKFQLLANHDLLILPSYNENFANVVIEAIAVNTPVLLSNHVGLKDYVIENNLGLAFKLDEIKIALEKMYALLIDNQILIKSKNQFYPDQLPKKYMEMYQAQIN